MEINRLWFSKCPKGVKQFFLSIDSMLSSSVFLRHFWILLRKYAIAAMFKRIFKPECLSAIWNAGRTRKQRENGKVFHVLRLFKIRLNGNDKANTEARLWFTISMQNRRNEQISYPVSSDKRALLNPCKFCLTCYLWKSFFMNLNLCCLLSLYFSSCDWAASILKLISLLSPPTPTLILLEHKMNRASFVHPCQHQQ